MTSASPVEFASGHIGAKATNLNLLMAMDLPVPAMFALPDDSNPIDRADLWEWVGAHASEERGEWQLAVRSSSAQEDGHLESKAGHFLSLIGSFDRGALLEAIDRVRRSGPDMGVIVQRLVDARYAGAFFSCDPLTFERRVATIAWTEGLADDLLNGSISGQLARLDRSGRVTEGSWPGQSADLELLRAAAAKLEKLFGAPADIEWAIDQSGQLWFLQARPVVLPAPTHISLGDAASIDSLPSTVRQHHKIRLRRQAAMLGVKMAPAVAATHSGSSRHIANMSSPFQAAAAASVVLLHPEHINCAIVREFAPTQGTGMRTWTERCRRYAIRRYPSVDGIQSAVSSVLQAGLGQSWTATTIVQAVWDAAATGIIRRTDDSYIVDIAQGHFVPKGVVTTSTILLARDGAVINAQWREQATAYHFIDGHVVTETPPKRQLRLPDDELALIARTLDPLFDVYCDAALEFGILDHDGTSEVYLIDVAEGDASSIKLDQDMIASGVISTGVCNGNVVRIENRSAGALDSHLHDRQGLARGAGDDPVIIVADRASTDLLGHVCAPGVAGFIFRQASMLAHLPVVLREKGIPAIVLEDDETHLALATGLAIEVDASSRLATARDRIRSLDGDAL
jgi:phosphohistidine swiveling domain-containing protein